MAASLGFIEESHEKFKQGSVLYQTPLLYKTNFTELKPENTSKLIIFKDFSLEFGICIAVELSHKKSNFALRKHPHMFYTPSFTFLYSRKGEMRGTQNEGLFSGLD